MPRIAKTDPAAKGIYVRKKSYWLRYSHNRKQLRIPLHTQDFAEAVEAAKLIRGRPEEAKAKKQVPGKTPTWKQAIDQYIEDKLAGRKPPHLKNPRFRSFRPGTASRTMDILDFFGRWTGLRSPFEVTAKKLQEYYDFRKIRSVASAKTIVDRICCFFEHIGHFIQKPEYPEEDAKEIREVTVAPEEYSKMIEECGNPTLKFVLYCGFHCGMRKAEIVHARPAWIKLQGKDPSITIPFKEPQRLANGKIHQWRNKNGKKSRSTPLGSEFAAWLQQNLDRDALFCIRPQSVSKRYRYDPRKSFEAYMQKFGRQDVSMHAMRHSYITNLCNSDNPSITIMKVSAWSGDTIETIQRHYWHKQVSSEGLDETLKGQRSGDTLKEVAAALKAMNTTGLDKETADAVKMLLKAAEEKKESKWDWTDKAPSTHVKLYSVEDTVSKLGVFRLLLDPGDNDPESAITEQDWEEGNVSTPRARLGVLQRRGWLQLK